MQIVLALDESEYGERILRWTKVWPHPRETRVTVVHVLEPMDIPDAIGARGRYLLEQQQRAAGEALISAAIRSLEKIYPETKGILREGLPIYELLKLLREERPDLVICGTRGLMAARGLVLGSVSQRLLNYAPCSVLLLPAKAKPVSAPRVILATDGSEGAKSAARWVAGFPDIKAITVLSAVRPVDMQELAIKGLSAKEVRKMQAQFIRARRDIARKAIEETADILTASTAKVTTRMVSGHPAKAITLAAQRDGCDLVVLGSRGLTGMEAVALGSVSLAVAQTATCPVLIVKPSLEG